MKKTLQVLMILGGIVLMVACGKEEPSEEQLATFMNTDWAKLGLYGKVKKMVKSQFHTIKWDSEANKPMVPTEINSSENTEFNKDGYITLHQKNYNLVTGAKKLPDNRVVVTKSEQQARVETKVTRDSKNRELVTLRMSYYYYTTFAGVDLYNSYYEGDTLFYTANNADPLEIHKDIYFSDCTRIETTYDDVAKTATIIIYSLQPDMQWKARGERRVVTLNQYGFVDMNSSISYYYSNSSYSMATTQFKESPALVDYKETDEHGNWILRYGLQPSSVYVVSYESRSIEYY